MTSPPPTRSPSPETADREPGLLDKQGPLVDTEWRQKFREVLEEAAVTRLDVEQLQKSVETISQLEQALKELSNKLDKVDALSKECNEKRRLFRTRTEERLSDLEKCKLSPTQPSIRIPRQSSCVLCGGDHQFPECAVFPKAEEKHVEFLRRGLCLRCAQPGCDIRKCGDPFVVCATCAGMGIRESRYVHHLTDVCDRTKREAALALLHRPGRKTPGQTGAKRPAKRQPLKPLNKEAPSRPSRQYPTNTYPQHMLAAPQPMMPLPAGNGFHGAVGAWNSGNQWVPAMPTFYPRQ